MRSSRYFQLNDQDWLREQVAQGRSASQMAEEIGCHRQAVNRALAKLDLRASKGFRRQTYAQLADRDWLVREIQTKPLRQVAEEAGCSYSAVLHAVRKHNIEVPHRGSHRYNPEKSANVKAGLKRRYPNGRFGPDASNWKGGRSKHEAGYVFVHAPDHPRARQNRVFEHILVAEEKLGRFLLPTEVVHHINHVKDDNRPENLEVKLRGQHVKDHFDAGRDVAGLRAEVERLTATLVAHGIDPEV